MNQKSPLELLRSIVADAEAMLNPGPLNQLGYDNSTESDYQPKDFFGPFTSYVDEGEGYMVTGGRVTVEWPNLSILIDEANRVLALHSQDHAKRALGWLLASDLPMQEKIARATLELRAFGLDESQPLVRDQDPAILLAEANRVLQAQRPLPDADWVESAKKVLQQVSDLLPGTLDGVGGGTLVAPSIKVQLVKDARQLIQPLH
jgi:hypothetical protein